MKAEDLKFPMVVQWDQNKYVVEQRGRLLDWTLIGNDPKFFGASLDKEDLAYHITHRHVVVLAQPSPAKDETAPITIEVDSSEAVAKLEAATKAAKELEAALTAVKGMLK